MCGWTGLYTSHTVSAAHAGLARRVVRTLGGRYSAELGIDVDAGDAEVERWFVAATLFGTRISARVAERTFSVLTGAGLVRLAQARHVPWEDLVGYFDDGGYARYDFRTATRLRALAEVIDERYGGQGAAIGRRFTTYPELRDALDVLPGWGPVTIQLLLRELRGVWPGAAEAGLDVRDLESALVRLVLAHRHGMASCPPRFNCDILAGRSSKPEKVS